MKYALGLVVLADASTQIVALVDAVAPHSEPRMRHGLIGGDALIGISRQAAAHEIQRFRRKRRPWPALQRYLFAAQELLAEQCRI